MSKTLKNISDGHIYEKVLDVDDNNDSLSVIFSYVATNSVVLDVGCACGDLAGELVYQKKCTVYGIEYNPQSVEICRKKNIFKEVAAYDLNNLPDKLLTSYKKKFDYIILGDVLEHLVSPLDVLQKIKNCLKPEGYIIISVPNVAHASIKANLLLNDWSYTEIGILDKTHLHFFSSQSLPGFIASAGLEVLNVQYTTLPPDGYQPHKVNELPPAVYDFIMTDIHSHIMQYICLCKISPISKAKLKRANSSLFNSLGSQIPGKRTSLYRIKRFIVAKMPGMLKYIQFIRSKIMSR